MWRRSHSPSTLSSNPMMSVLSAFIAWSKAIRWSDSMLRNELEITFRLNHRAGIGLAPAGSVVRTRSESSVLTILARHSMALFWHFDGGPPGYHYSRFSVRRPGLAEALWRLKEKEPKMAKCREQRWLCRGRMHVNARPISLLNNRDMDRNASIFARINTEITNTKKWHLVPLCIVKGHALALVGWPCVSAILIISSILSKGVFLVALNGTNWHFLRDFQRLYTN
jgi:hypothetical protein